MGLSDMAATLLAAIPGGQYVSAVKAIPLILILLIWARLLTWVDKDSVNARLPRIALNLGLFGGMAGCFFLALVLPGFLIAILVLVLGLMLEAGVYLGLRHKQVGLGDLSIEFKNWLRSLGGKKKEAKEVEGSVQIVSPSGGLIPAPASDEPEAEAFNAIQQMMTVPLENYAEIIEFSPSEAGYAVKYAVDGVAYTGATVSKAAGAAAMAYLKDVAELDLNEVRKPQTGNLRMNINHQKREIKLTTKGSTAGESARFLIDPKKRHSFTIEKLGLLEDQIATIRASVQEGSGIVLLSAPKGQGLTSLSYAVLRAHDAFLQHLISIERDPEQELEGITQTLLPPGSPAAEETKQIAWMVSQQPDVMLVGKPEAPQSAVEMIKGAKEGRRIYVSLVAPNTFDTLTLWRKLVGNDELAMSQLKMIISGRTVRKLCVACKQGYMPDPETLRKLNIDPTKVEQLFQAPKEAPKDPKGNIIHCEFCNDLRYKGRTGIYEILTIDDEIRQLIMGGGTAAQLKTAFRKQRGKYLQELGLALVESGDSSVQEVLRILRSGESAKPAAKRA
jgi:type II secretory ATPase GspE/PulE/Tfp pilus assembly ATPase PilB-like protein